MRPWPTAPWGDAGSGVAEGAERKSRMGLRVRFGRGVELAAWLGAGVGIRSRLELGSARRLPDTALPIRAGLRPATLELASVVEHDRRTGYAAGSASSAASLSDGGRAPARKRSRDSADDLRRRARY